MICVATNDQTAFDNIIKWKIEIQLVEPEKPIMLILTKGDLVYYLDDLIELDDIKRKAYELDLLGAMETSSQDWQDYNI